MCKTEVEYVGETKLVHTEKLPNGSKFAYGYDSKDRVTAISQSDENGESNSKIVEKTVKSLYCPNHNKVFILNCKKNIYVRFCCLI